MKTLVIFLILSIMVASCSSSEKIQEFPGDWRARMQQLKSSYTKLLPLVLDEEQFNSDKNFDDIYTNTKTLYALAGDLSKHTNKDEIEKVDVDPSLNILSDAFKKEIGTALEGLKTQRRDYSRFMLKSSLQYCIQCHSRSGQGPSYDAKIEGIDILSRVEKAEVLIAFRNYNQALEVLKLIITAPLPSEKESYQSQKAIDLALQIAVEHEKSPKTTSIVLNWIDNSQELGASTKSLVKKWRKNVSEWERAKANRNQLSQAKGLIDRAEDMQSYWGDRSSYLLYLRATSLLHDYLRTRTNKMSSQNYAESLYQLGRAYTAQPQHRFSYMADHYFKTCIFALPHSEMARRCFSAYETQVINKMDFRSHYFPKSGRDYLEYLEKMAN